MYREDKACQELVQKMAPTYDYEGLMKKHDAEKAIWEPKFAEWKLKAEEAKKAGQAAPPPPRGPQPVGKAR